MTAGAARLTRRPRRRPNPRRSGGRRSRLASSSLCGLVVTGSSFELAAAVGAPSQFDVVPVPKRPMPVPPTPVTAFGLALTPEPSEDAAGDGQRKHRLGNAASAFTRSVRACVVGSVQHRSSLMGRRAAEGGLRVGSAFTPKTHVLASGVRENRPISRGVREKHHSTQRNWSPTAPIPGQCDRCDLRGGRLTTLRGVRCLWG